MKINEIEKEDDQKYETQQRNEQFRNISFSEFI